MSLLHTKQSQITPTHLVSLYEMMQNNKDEKNARKISELYKKLINDEYVISFTGHFSAGKSSMINTLLEEDILPKSPIPTSGNIVEIKSGKGEARVFLSNNEVKIYKKPYDVEVIKDYCKDNQGVKKVELNTENNILPERCTIIDTPGIDAADDGDRIITESSLHLADKIIYIMDYNHVQSEVNLTFLKEIQKRGTPFTVVINQIDKHSETEMTFQNFKDSVKQTFEQWQIMPETTYYTSLINPGTKHNTFQQFKNDLFKLLTTEKDTFSSIRQSTEIIVGDHKDQLREELATRIEAFSLPDNTQDYLTKLKTIIDEIANLENRPTEIEKRFQAILSETLKNAYLMPAKLRDNAMSFLESRQTNFKLGLFSSKKKIAIEQERRLNNFLEPLQKNIEATIQWRLRDKVIALLNEYNLVNSSLTENTQNFLITYTKEDLFELIKPGAKLNGNYVLNYTNDVSVDIKEKFKLQARKLYSFIHNEIIKQTSNEINDLEVQKANLEIVKNNYDKQEILESKLTERFKQIDQQLMNPVPSDTAWKLIAEAKRFKEQVSENPTNNVIKTGHHFQSNMNDEIMPQSADDASHKTIDNIVTSIDETLQTIESFPGFQTIINDLKRKREKLKNRTLTVALFGAFSAGKSSFANALLGKSLLPSSPNPTTAVINRISPPTESEKHGTVIINFKQEKTLIDDVISITKDLSPPDVDFNNLIEWLKESKIEQNNDLNKMYQAYLQALMSGYNQGFFIGAKTLRIKLEDFSEYVTDEKKACYIESVTLYYDNPLTRLGISLVDTPGADSVNARHTNVAFDYIKQADAILYITYYNHALSRADKNFLMQLGRVKDAFELDKMFFIINAADLAESSSDLQLVREYVEEQLNQLGIRFPRIFPVSSKESLHSKINHRPLNKQMKTFEHSFYYFINHELAALSIDSALWDMTRAHKLLLSYIENANLDVKEREVHLNQLEHNKQNLLKQVGEINASIFDERITQRIDRQLHFVNERLSIRFHDLFKDHFNPATITDIGERIRNQLVKNLNHLLQDTGYELLQELRAVSLRMESFIDQLIQEIHDEIRVNCSDVDKEFMLPKLEKIKLKTPHYSDPFSSLETQQFNKVLSRFKGLKAFFEKNEKNIMRDELYTMLLPHIKSTLSDNYALMIDSNHKQWHALIRTHRLHVKEDVNHYINDRVTMIGDQINLNKLKETEHALSKIVAKANEGEQ